MNLKLIALLLISFIATGSVIYNIRNRRPARPAGVVVVPGGVAPSPTAAAPAAPARVPAPVSAETSAPEPIAAARPDQSGPRPNIPASGWGRNPFLTIEEIDKLNQPDQTAVVEAPAPKPVVEPATLPAYVLMGILTGEKGNIAIIDGRTLRAGSRIGSETVKEVKDRGIVLEHKGQLRELRLRSIEETAAAVPKKETKQ
jgi:hypothetical protein